ncbi:MAG TPA: cyclic nucleotide-binding domain-containing protein, partial [Candidatus Limnocylindrales bacterium]|nr:cyclic nucleotide-binding domain-containing protein [Candidatus Limnocylindrales bacterium]
MEEIMDPERAASIPLLAVLDRRALGQVLRTARERTYAPGDVVVAEGDPATRLFVIVDGTTTVEQGGQSVGKMGPGEFFGELALIEEHGRTATIRADTDLTCLVITA